MNRMNGKGRLLTSLAVGFVDGSNIPLKILGFRVSLASLSVYSLILVLCIELL